MSTVLTKGNPQSGTTCPVHGDKYLINDSFRCSACVGYNESSDHVGRRAAQKQDKPLSYNLKKRVTVIRDNRGRLNQEHLAAMFRQIARDDPERLAEMALEARRPPGVARERFGISARSAVREPMLNAHKDTIERSLRLGLTRAKTAPIKERVYKRIVVKPKNLAAAKAGRTSAFWGERLWTIHTLKYARGYTITADTGETSRVFQTYGELASAVTKSGWEILR